MKVFAITDGELFLQGFSANEKYVSSGRAIQTDLHSYSEYTPTFGHEPKWFDSRTVTDYLRALIDYLRWEGDSCHTYTLVCKEEADD